jgi:oxygen-independent coproporphyrinogen-3 oxidase
MWLTRTFKPFTFTNNYDYRLNFDDCENLGLYVHIPFCKKLCAFCPYCKEVYTYEKCDDYIDYLIKEIHLVGSQMSEKKQVTSLYFGGGTPALAAYRLKEIIAAINEYFIITDGIGLELHPDNVKEETLLTLQESGVSRISIGIQSFQKKFLSVLGRKEVDFVQLSEVLKRTPFETVSMDFIFALPNQTIEDLKADIEMAFSSGANHIAIYPFINFTFTDSTVQVMGKKEKRELLDEITIYCQEKGYVRDSIWTFSNSEHAKYSSMTRDNFLGFGCSATTLLKKQFKVNTFSVEEYKKRIDRNELPTSLTIRFTKRQRMMYFLFWTAYSTKVNPDDFQKFFNVSLKKMYGFEFWIAQKLGFIIKENGIYLMTLKGAFYYHYYENYYTLSYIDQMWDVMRKEAFPDKISF